MLNFIYIPEIHHIFSIKSNGPPDNLLFLLDYKFLVREKLIHSMYVYSEK